MKLSFEEIKNITFGALEINETDSGMRFHKCTKKQEEAFLSLSPVLGQRALSTTGIRLDFHTDSDSFGFYAPSGKKFDLYADGLLYRQYILGEERTVTADLSKVKRKRDVRITLYFPAHDLPCVLGGVELDDRSYVTPQRFDRKMLFIGDSITQGWNSKYDSFSYANRVSRFFNAESVINGIGGAYFDPSVFDRVPFDPDTVIIAYGTNDFSVRKTKEELREKVSAFLSLAADEYVRGGKRVYAISPIPRGDIDAVKPMGSFFDCRDIIIEEIERYGIRHIDGMSLLPYSEDLFADALHPNDLGFAQYAESLIKKL